MPIHVRGLSAAESPLPDPELALGNVVRLKEPYRGDRGRAYSHGIIVEHVGWNAFGKPMVSLHLYDDAGQMYLIPRSHVPHYVDCVASDLLLLTIAKHDQVFPDGLDLYPPCPVCQDIGQHPFAAHACPACGGWGCVKELRRWPG